MLDLCKIRMVLLWILYCVNVVVFGRVGVFRVDSW